MSERGPNLSSLEVKFTVGKTEKPVEKKIHEAAKKIAETGVLKRDNFNNERERKEAADQVIGSLGMGFWSYENLVDATCDPSRPWAQKNGETTFDMLRRSVSLAMNTSEDQELQTRLFTGGVREILPESWKYNNMGASNLDLEQGVMEVTITDSEILDKVRKLDKTKKRVNLENQTEREHFASKVDEVVVQLLDMDVPDESEDQLIAVKSYLSTEAGILRNELKQSDSSADEPDIKAVLGEAAEKISKAAEKMAQTVEEQGKVVEKQGEVVEKQSETVEKFEFNLNELYKNKVEGEILGEVEDGKTKEDLMENTGNEALREGLAVNNGKKQIEKTDLRERKLPPGGIDELYRWVEFIEDGVASVDDLSRNADKYRILYAIQKGEFNKQLEGLDYRGKTLTESDVKEFCDEVGARMFLHSFYLASSKCKSVEDILRTVSSMHEGEMENDWDRFLVGSFLETRGGRKGIGLRELPVQKAWDLRQDGYFKIDEVFDDIKGNGSFIDYLKKEKGDLWGKIEGKGGLNGVLKLDIEIAKTDTYGVPKDIYKNFFQYQKAGGVDYDLIREYMLWQLMDNGSYSRTEAERAFVLAQKLSVATFSDSKVNLNFAADDYAELILFKYVRISNGPGGKPDSVKLGKSKPIGAGETIKFMDTLTCHWMDLCIKKEKKEWRTVYNPLYSGDIDFSKMGGKGNMPYHFFGVVNSQVLGVQEGFYEKLSAKDLTALNYLPKIFAKINKTAYDMVRAGIMPVYYDDEKDIKAIYETGGEKEIEARVAEKMRKTWLMNLMYMAGNQGSGWTSEELNLFEKMLLKNNQLFDKKGNQGASFIPKKDVYHVMSMTKVGDRIYKNTISGKFRKLFSQ